MSSIRMPISGRSKIIRQLLGTMAHSPRRAGQIARDFSTLRQSPLFDQRFYLRQNPGVAEAEMNPVLHYVAFGVAEGLDPSPAFGTESYLRAHPHLRRSGTNPLAHLERLNERRDNGAGQAPMGRELQPAAPKTSVIVMSGGESRALSVAVRSTLAQTTPPLEVIVCDESADGAAQRVLEESFAGAMRSGAVRWLQGDPALGHSARNDGVGQARGELVAYLRDDCEWEPRYLESVGEALGFDQVACIAREGKAAIAAGEKPEDPVEISSFAHRRRLQAQLGGFDESLGKDALAELTTRYSRVYRSIPAEGTMEIVLLAPSSGGRRSAGLAKAKIDRIYGTTKGPFTLTVLADTGDPTFAARLQLAVADGHSTQLLLLDAESWRESATTLIARKRDDEPFVCLTLTETESEGFLPEAAPPLPSPPTCNLCGSPDATLSGEPRPGICSVCGSTPFGRTAFRQLVGLPGLHGLDCGSDVDDRALAEQLERMFDVTPLQLGASDPGADGRKLPLAIVDLGSRPVGELVEAVRAIDSALVADAVVIAGGTGKSADALEDAFVAAGFETQRVSSSAGDPGSARHTVLIAQRSAGVIIPR